MWLLIWKLEVQDWAFPLVWALVKVLLVYATAWRRHRKESSKLGVEVDKHAGQSYFKECNLNMAGRMAQMSTVASTHSMRKTENEDNIDMRCCYETFMTL